MALKAQAPKEASTGKTDFGRLEDGTHMARVVQIIDLGRQRQHDWKTKEPKLWDDGNPMIKAEVFITFEFPTERIDIKGESKPRWLSKKYTMSLHEKSALTALIAAVDPVGAKTGSYDIGQLIDKPVMVTVGTTSGGNAKVTGVSGVPKGFNVDPLYNPTTVFDMDDFDMETFNRLPNFIQEDIQRSEDFKGFPASSEKKEESEEESEAQDDGFDDDIPF